MDERALPLDNLDGNFIAGDALIRSELMGLDEERSCWRTASRCRSIGRRPT